MLSQAFIVYLESGSGTCPLDPCDGMTVESLRQLHNSCPRNKLIAKVFHLAGYIENWGRGIEKVDYGFKAAGLAEPQYEESCGGVVTIIPRRNQMEGSAKTGHWEIIAKN